MNGNICPICGYRFKRCQCRYWGSAHPDMSKNADVVKDHLYLLSVKQLLHLIKLQKFWQTSYEDDEKTEMLKLLKETGDTNK